MADKGRPSSYSEELAATICLRLMEGESLRSICLDEAMPARSTVHLWLATMTDFSDRYARAREAQADTLFDEILDIADDGSNDWIERKRDDGSTEEVLNHEHLQRSKLRVDSRKWMAARMLPKKYGDKLDVTSGGEAIGLAGVIAERRAKVAALNEGGDGDQA